MFKLTRAGDYCDYCGNHVSFEYIIDSTEEDLCGEELDTDDWQCPKCEHINWADDRRDDL